MKTNQCKALTTYGNRCRKPAVTFGYCEIHNYLLNIKPNKIAQTQRRKRGISLRVEVSPEQYEFINRLARTLGFNSYPDYVRYVLFQQRETEVKKMEIIWKERNLQQEQIFQLQQYIGKIIGSTGIKVNGTLVRFCCECGRQLTAKRDEKADRCYACRKGIIQAYRTQTERSIWQDLAALPGASKWLKEKYGGK